MQRKKVFLAFVVILIFALAAALIAINFTEQGNHLTAENFVKNEATYKFDGIPETFNSTGKASLDCPFCFEFNFGYQSRNSGYGDRNGMVLASMITDHRARITIEGGKIQSATLDDIWNMKTQRLIDTGNSSVDIERESVR